MPRRQEEATPPPQPKGLPALRRRPPPHRDPHTHTHTHSKPRKNRRTSIVSEGSTSSVIVLPVRVLTCAAAERGMGITDTIIRWEVLSRHSARLALRFHQGREQPDSTSAQKCGALLGMTPRTHEDLHRSTTGCRPVRPLEFCTAGFDQLAKLQPGRVKQHAREDFRGSTYFPGAIFCPGSTPPPFTRHRFTSDLVRVGSRALHPT